MDSETERRRAEAEAVRQQRELERQTAEHARDAAEASRVAAENGRRALADDVSDTVETLTIILKRMEAVEALRRDARNDTNSRASLDPRDAVEPHLCSTER